MIGKKISHYKILEKLGEGGMGIVYLAEDTKLDRKVAIKFLPHNFEKDSEERQRLTIEAKAAASLNHANIATIYSIEETDDDIFIVMEYVAGQELKKKINIKPLPVDEALSIAQQIADGLAAAHDKGIVHRDIKSSNIMITPEGKIKIMDFGLAKVRGGAQVTKLGTTVGTAAYMSPEQGRGEEVDQRTDIWSFGVILCEMLTGSSPFRGNYEHAIMYSVQNEEPAFASPVPAGLEPVLLKLLAKDPAQRYQHLEEVSQNLRDINKNETPPVPKALENSIAVLPFKNISPDQEADYFADGLAEELIVNLSKIKDLRVIPRTTSIRYKDSDKDIKTIGRELSAIYVMTGSVRKFQDNLRISVQLIDALHDTQQWAETYKGKLADVFDIQETVSKQIVEALQIELTPTQEKELGKRGTENHEAFDRYLRAKGLLYKMTKKDVRTAIELFQKALDVDPHYAGAYAGLSEGYGVLYQYFEKRDDLLTSAVETGLKALSIDPSLPDAHAALAQAYLRKDMRNEAFAAGEKAIELDPNSFIGHWTLGRIYFINEKYVEALELFKRVATLNPDFYTVFSDLRMCYIRLGLPDKAAEMVEQRMGFFPDYLFRHPDDARGQLFYAIDLALVGKPAEARKHAGIALKLNPDDALMQYNAACFYSTIGDKREGIDSLKKAIASGWLEYSWLKTDPDFDNIRDEPEFMEILKGEPRKG